MSGHTIILGGAGFIGTALARKLQKDRPVLVVDTAQRLAAAEKWLVDIAQAECPYPDLSGISRTLEGAAALVHLSCTSTPASSMTDLARDATQNVVSSVRLFELAGQAGVSRVVFASSGGTVYGNPERTPVFEQDAGRPVSGYGASKLAIEQFLYVAGLRDGFSGISLRIGNPYGVYQLQGTAIGVIAHYLARVSAGESPEIWGDGSIIRDYIHVDDVISAFEKALDTPDLKPQAYNIGSGQGISISEIWQMIRDVTGTALEPTFKATRGFDVDAIVLDTSSFQAATGWQAEISLVEGVAQLWNHMLQRESSLREGS